MQSLPTELTICLSLFTSKPSHQHCNHICFDVFSNLIRTLSSRNSAGTIAGCNRTYYGNLGITYDLELHRPKEDKIPYVCELNFTAAGGVHGDIIQVSQRRRPVRGSLAYTRFGINTT